MPKAYRDKAAEAATRRKVTLGAYVCRALDLAVLAERAPAERIRSASEADPMADMSAMSAVVLSEAASRVAVIERAVAAATALAAAPGIPAGFRRRANRLLRESLPPATPRVPAAARRALVVVADGDD